MSKNNQLATVEKQPSVALMLQEICKQGITAENTEAMTQLMKLHERMEDRQAERDFNAAFAALQAETPDIVATSVIPNRGKYEKFEDVMHVMRPLLSKHGFSVSFSQETGERITVTCHLRHASGHSQQTKFGVRLGGKADSETQADCKASTTAKRNSLLQALNIVIRQDCMQDEDDARITGEVIDAEQASSLFERVKACGADATAFLAYAGARNFSEISASRYDALDAMLSRKEKAKA